MKVVKNKVFYLKSVLRFFQKIDKCDLPHYYIINFGEVRVDNKDNNFERRRFKRFNVKSRCWCEAKSITMYVEVLNIGQGGLFIKTYSPLSIGEIVKVRWKSMVSGQEFVIPSEVVWKREFSNNPNLPPGMGLKFGKIFEDIEKEMLIQSF